MPSLKPGKKKYQLVLDEESQAQITLLEWARNRGLSPGVAARCIVVDWSEAICGKPNPFAMAIASAAIANMNRETGPIQMVQTASQSAEPEISPEELARQKALLDAEEQFV
jgi:hypothetical protein